MIPMNKRTYKLIVMLALTLTAGPLAAQGGSDPFAQEDAFVRAAASFARGDVAGAEALLVPLPTNPEPSANVYILLGDIRVSQKRPDEAVTLFRQAAVRNQKSPTALSRLGTALLAQAAGAGVAEKPRLVAEGLAALHKSLEIDPEHYDGCLTLARYYTDTPPAAGGDYDQAVRYAGMVKNADDMEGTLLLGIAAERFGRLETALERYRELLRIFDGNPRLLANEARVLARLGRTAEAQACYERLLGRFPNFEPARSALAALKAAAAPVKAH
jgi:tetratricopeptide (TPR) repeat protein